MSDIDLALRVNGRDVQMRVPAQTSLVDLLREHLHLTGTHVGCDTAQCGACTVLLDGAAVKACNVLAAQAAGHEVSTIEGVANRDGTLHPLQAALQRHHGLQCGFCTPGMVMSALELLRTRPDADETAVRRALEGNLCRCTGYHGIVAAVLDALAQQRAARTTAG